MLLHDLEELDHDLGHRANEDLALATLLRVVHRLRSGGDGVEEGQSAVPNPRK